MRARGRNKHGQEARELLWEVGDKLEASGRAGQSGTGGERQGSPVPRLSDGGKVHTGWNATFLGRSVCVSGPLGGHGWPEENLKELIVYNQG